MIFIRRCEECGTLLSIVHHPLCLPCRESPRCITNTSHTCTCEFTDYGPSTSLHDIQKDREREKEQAAA